MSIQPAVYVGHYSSFILRLWIEPDNDMRWGIIQHVATRQKLRFSTVPEMLDFISKYSAEGEISIPFILDESDGASDRSHEVPPEERNVK